MDGRVVGTRERRHLRPGGALSRLLRGRLLRGGLPAALLLLPGCAGRMSTLDPAGEGAERIATLFAWLAGGATVIWLAVVLLAVAVSRAQPGPPSRRTARALIIGGGAVFPTVVLCGVLVYGLSLMPGLLARAPPDSLQVSVTGEQWWWRVRYLSDRGQEQEVVLANEIHLPVGEPVQFRLESRDVIHSFWIPSLGGKLDMIPGRVNWLTLRPTRTGSYRGVCAEYCGASHALMLFEVVVEEREAFERWLAHQARPALPPASPLAERGQAVFLANGCGACHAVRGTPADGVVGPDLTHVGSRLTLGAGILPNAPEPFRRWVAHTGEVKPGVLMPAFGMLPEEDLQALAAYLEGLK